MKKPIKTASGARDRAPPVKDVTHVAHVPARAQTTEREGDWQVVRSSNIHRIKWERVLTVEFHGGKQYEYSGVDEKVWRALMGAGSHGSFLATEIVNKYPARRK